MIGMEVELSEADMRTCRDVARLRYDQVLARRVEGYGRIGNEMREIGFMAHYHGALGECAVVRAIDDDANVVWNKFVDGSTVDLKALPEISWDLIDIDAKAISRNWYSLLVQAGTVKIDWLYVLVGVQHAPRCIVGGCMWGKDLLQVPITEPQPRRPGHLVPQGDARLKPFGNLLTWYRKTPVCDAALTTPRTRV